MSLCKSFHLVFLLTGFWTVIGLPNLGSAQENSPPRIELASSDAPGDRTIEVRGLPKALQKQIATWKADDPRFREWFAVFVGKMPQAGQPAMLGDYQVTKTGLAFVPRFGLEAGTTYCARLSLPGREPQLEAFALPAAAPTKPANITAVYPSGDKLPENLLRVYLHFSAPMSQGKSYRYLHLFDRAGEEVQSPFLELPQELWSADGTRLTVLLDPGRVKQGLKPREQSGPVLIPGRKYTFTIDDSWPDATGQPLQKPFKKIFQTTKADVIQPKPAQWKIESPQAGTRDPLTMIFDEPLDHGMLQRVLSVWDAKSVETFGQIHIDKQETRWRFTPEKPWQPGRHTLKIRTILEDRVGNSIARPFEVDLNQPPPPIAPKFLHRTFEIAQ